MYAHKSKGRFSSPRMPSHQPQKDADKSRLARFSALSAVHPAEMDAGYQYKCSYTDIAEDFGRLLAADDTEISHVQGTADANDTFALNSGALSVTTNRAADASYYLEDGKVKIEATNGVVISAQASFAARNTVRTVSFKYNHNGLRTQKTVVENGITTTYDYTLHGKLITHLTKSVVNSQNVETGREELHFFYDSQSRPAFVEYDNAMYRYVHNLQGDIVAIVDETGNAVVEYKYDAWGKALNSIGSLATTLGKLNPFRYRGYVYDEETGLYYLRSRYYSIYYNRFLNLDEALSKNRRIFDNNLYCYCFNAPIKYIDSTGRYPGENGNKQSQEYINPLKHFGISTTIYSGEDHYLVGTMSKVYSIDQSTSEAINQHKLNEASAISETNVKMSIFATILSGFLNPVAGVMTGLGSIYISTGQGYKGKDSQYIGNSCSTVKVYARNTAEGVSVYAARKCISDNPHLASEIEIFPLAYIPTQEELEALCVPEFH